MPSTGEEPLEREIVRLTDAGYKDDFRGESEGLRAVVSGCLHEPESLVIDEIVRFQDDTDPDEEAILFALRCTKHGARGTYVVPYGLATSPVGAEMVQRLAAAFRR